MFEIQLRDIVENAKFFAQLNQKPLRAKTAYKIATLIRELEPHLANYNDIYNSLLEKYGTLEDDEKKRYTFSLEQKELFDKEYVELLNEAIQINCNKINIADLDEIEISASQMRQMMPFIEE